MDIPEISDEERAARRYGQRKHDKLSIEVYVAAVFGAGGFAGTALMALPTTSRMSTAVLMAVGAVFGAIVAGGAARALRTRNVWLLLPVSASGMSFGVVALALSPVGSPTVVAMPTVSTVVVSNGGSAGEVQSLPIGFTEHVGETLTCSVNVVGTAVLPSKECNGRVKLEAFGAPTTGPSAWSLPNTTSLIIESPAPDAELIRLWPATDGPQCVGQSDAIDAASSMSVRSWMDRVRLVEFVESPVGTKVILWAECSDPSAGTGIDNTQGWFLTVE